MACDVSPVAMFFSSTQPFDTVPHLLLTQLNPIHANQTTTHFSLGPLTQGPVALNFYYISRLKPTDTTQTSQLFAFSSSPLTQCHTCYSESLLKLKPTHATPPNPHNSTVYKFVRPQYSEEPQKLKLSIE